MNTAAFRNTLTTLDFVMFCVKINTPWGEVEETMSLKELHQWKEHPELSTCRWSASQLNTSEVLEITRDVDPENQEKIDAKVDQLIHWSVV